MCDVYVCPDPFLSFALLRNNLYFIFSLQVQAPFIIIIISIIVIIIFILFSSTLLVYWERFQWEICMRKWVRAVWSTPTHLFLWVNRRVTFCKIFFRDHRWGADSLFDIYYMTSINYDAFLVDVIWAIAR